MGLDINITPHPEWRTLRDEPEALNRYSQVYVAMISYLLLSYLKFSSRSPLSLYEFAKRVEVSLFDRVDIRSLLAARMFERNEQRKLELPVQLAFKWDGFNPEVQTSMKRIENALRIP